MNTNPKRPATRRDSSVPCQYAPAGAADPWCWHGGCVLASIQDPIARRVSERNSDIRWNLLENWGRFNRAARRGSEQRCALARAVRHMRAGGNFADVVRCLVWESALAGRRREVA